MKYHIVRVKNCCIKTYWVFIIAFKKKKTISSTYTEDFESSLDLMSVTYQLGEFRNSMNACFSLPQLGNNSIMAWS